MREFGKLNFSVSFKRTSAFPICADDYFESLTSAQEAAQTAVEVGSAESTYYIGQTLTVVENGTSKSYIIQPDKSLKEIGANSGEQSNYNDLTNKPRINNIELVGNKTLDELNIQKKGDYALKSEIPDVSNFITKSVNDLINYYNKNEINNLLSNKITFEIVESLPTTGVSNKIYLVPSKKQTSQNIKDEFIWISNKWEQIGSTEIDLSNYYTKTEIDNLVYVVNGPLSEITEKIEVPDLQEILGNTNDFLNAARLNKPIYAKKESNGDGEFMVSYIPIIYQYFEVINQLYLTYFVDGIFYYFQIDVSDGWGGILGYTKIDLRVLNGKNTLIIGEYAHAEGISSERAYQNSEIPTDSTQIMMEWYMSSTGYSIAYGEGCHIEGKNNLCIGAYGHTEGIKNLVLANAGHAEGAMNTVGGVRAHGEGIGNYCEGEGCHGEGAMNTIKGTYAHAEGFRNTVEGISGHGEGYITFCKANYGHTEGRQTSTVGPCAHAEGYGNIYEKDITILSINKLGDYGYFSCNDSTDINVGTCLIIENIAYVVVNIELPNIYLNHWCEFTTKEYTVKILNGVAYGDNSHVGGEDCSAIGKDSFSNGIGCISFNDNEISLGKFNISYSRYSREYRGNETLFTFGIGTDKNNRKNSFELLENGDIYIIDVGGFDGTNSSSKNVRTVQQVLKELQPPKVLYYARTMEYPPRVVDLSYNGEYNDFIIVVRVNIAPTNMYTGPSFILYNGLTGMYYSNWGKLGPYQSSEEYFSLGSNYVPKQNTIYVKLGSDEKVEFKSVDGVFKFVTL